MATNGADQGGVSETLAALRDRIDELQAGQPLERAAMVADLETAHEQLRQAGEEVQTQQEELQVLMRAHLTGRAVHERVVALHPAAVVVTDERGVVQSVNPTAMSMLRTRVDRLVRRPIFDVVDVAEQADLPQRLADAVAHRTGFRVRAAVEVGVGRRLPAELAVTVLHDEAIGRTEVTWVLLSEEIETLGTPPDPLATSLAELASLPLLDVDRSALLSRVAHACRGAFAVGVSVSITTGPPAEPEAIGTDSKQAQRIDGAQVVAGEGPTPDAWGSGAPVVSERLGSDHRWPRLAKVLDEDSATSALAVPITIGTETLGTLTVYGQDPALTEPTAQRHAEILAATVAAVLQEVDAKAELEDLAQHLHRAMESRAPIEQAKGIVMAAEGCSAAEAFAILARMSNQQNVKIRDLAEQIIADTTVES
jgi:GAF domain-containing protein